MTFALCNFAKNLIKATAMNINQWAMIIGLACMIIPIDLCRKLVEKRTNK